MSPAVAVLLIMVGSAGLIGYLVGSASRPRDYRITALKEHARLLKKARRASLDDEDGLANIYAEAAERVLNSADRPK